MHQRNKVLFLCTGNSCRSQMAEAIVNHHLSETWEAFSAGTVPAGFTHPLAIKALAEIGIEHDGESKHADQFREQRFDIVITVCGDAEENCPVWLGPGIRIHMGFPDPAKAEGSEEKLMEFFRSVRDNIQEDILDFLRNQ